VSLVDGDRFQRLKRIGETKASGVERQGVICKRNQAKGMGVRGIFNDGEAAVTSSIEVQVKIIA
jgi:hypothetical protein